MVYDYDLIIIGGGAIGASLACALSKRSDLRLAVIEAVPTKTKAQAGHDERGLALSPTSKNILDNLGVWQNLAAKANPIRHIHISDRSHFGFIRLDSEQMKLEALGYVVPARVLAQGLIQEMQAADNIDLLCPATVIDVILDEATASVVIAQDGKDKILRSKLLIAADGTNSLIRNKLGITTRNKDYKQTAIVSSVVSERPHNDTAFERFTEDGPIALLPDVQQRYVLVFTVSATDTEKFMHMEEAEFLGHLLKRFGRRLGRFHQLGARKSYPLQMVQAKEQIKSRVVILGNAAHTVHPNGAQGLNLNLRDTAALAETLLEAKAQYQDIGALAVLESYLRARRKDQKRIIRFTNMLADGFCNGQIGKILGRNLAMLAIDVIPPVKRILARHLMGYWREQPLLIQGRTK